MLSFRIWEKIINLYIGSEVTSVANDLSKNVENYKEG